MMCIFWRTPLCLLGPALLLAGSVQAGIGLSLGSIKGDAWQAEQVELGLGDAADGAYRLVGRMARLVLPAALGEWQAVQLTCDELRLQRQEYHCAALQLQARTPQGEQQLQGELRFRDAQHWSLALAGLRLAGGRWQLQGQAAGDWQLSLEAQGVAPAGLLGLADGSGMPPWAWQGQIDLRGRLEGQGGAPARVSLTARLRGAGWSDPSGLQAAQGLAGEMRLQGRRTDGGWRLQLTSDWPAGQLYSDPVFVELAEHPLHLTATLRWPDDRAALHLETVAAGLGRLLQLSGAGRIPLGSPDRGELQLQAEIPDLAAVYPVLLQPFGYGRAMGELQVSGGAEAHLHWRDGGADEAGLRLTRLQLEDTQGRFGLDGGEVELHWVAQGPGTASHVQWQRGHLYQVDLGASRAELELVADQVRLTRPLALPMLQGRLHIPELQAAGLLGGQSTWRTALRAESLSLPALSRALGWPELAGELSVEIPAVHYADGLLAMDGELVAQAFDGTVRVTDLRLRDPLGPAPVFEAQASLRGLDLERLTRVFDFGRITGRLEGDVRGLQLVGWQPTAFEVELRNPPQDDLPHRISQRAVENLTALGNNGAVALSGTFLRFFESFSYDRMLLKVRLAGQRAVLDGIPHGSGGYYLVKGAGLPRIDVIGRNREVAWRDLVERLQRIRLQGAQIR